MNETNHRPAQLAPWKAYLTITAETLLTFYLATFGMAMYFTHRGPHWILTGVFLVILYVFILIVSAKRVIQQLPVPALMLVIPLAPLIAITVVISLIPVLQLFP